MYKSEIYLHQDVSPTKLLQFLKNEAKQNSDIHSFILYHNNELMESVALPPYSVTGQRQLYSLSKSFTSTAIGIACDRGLVHPSQKIVDLFRAECPACISENLGNMTVHHLLSMNTGHAACTMSAIANSNDGVRAFLACEVQYVPGTHFTYNTGATYMLSAIITKLTGLTLLDYLTGSLFVPLGITPALWQTAGGNRNEGGVGLYLSCADVVKLGLLYLNNGVFEGKRILSQEWVKTAQLPHSDNSANGNPDWCAGYGYQFWRNVDGGYRGDGAFGQYCVILPEENIVFACLTETWNMQEELTELIRYLRDYQKTDDQTVDLAKELSAFYPPYQGGTTLQSADRTYLLQPNAQGFTAVTVKQEGSTLSLSFSNGERIQTIKAANGAWIENEITAPAMKPTIVGLCPPTRPEQNRFMASCRMESEKQATLGIRYINCPHKGEIVLTISENEIKLSFNYREGTILAEARELKGSLIV